MPPVLLVLVMPSNCSVPVMCLTVVIALLTEVIAKALRLHCAQVRHQSLLTAILSVCEVGVSLGPGEAVKKHGTMHKLKSLCSWGGKRGILPCWVLDAYSHCPSIARSVAYPSLAYSHLDRTGRQGLAHAWRTPPWAEDGDPQMRRG